MPRLAENEWHAKACELIVREGCSLAEAVTRLKVPMTSAESANLYRTKTFQRLLRAERLRFSRELGTDPDWGKKTAVGILLLCAQKLQEESQYDKAAEVILKAAKIEGWLSSDAPNVTVFGGLSQRELDDARARLTKQTEDEASAKPN